MFWVVFKGLRWLLGSLEWLLGGHRWLLAFGVVARML